MISANYQKSKVYGFYDKNDEASIASRLFEIILLKSPRTVNVINVEKEEKYQQLDIDLILECYSSKGGIKKVTLEVKADQYFCSPNLYAETISNMNLMSKGCFLETKADFILYYYSNHEVLYVFETEKIRKWFVNTNRKFKKGHPITKNEKTGELLYVSEGAIVPRWAFKQDGVPFNRIDMSNLYNKFINSEIVHLRNEQYNLFAKSKQSISRL